MAKPKGSIFHPVKETVTTTETVNINPQKAEMEKHINDKNIHVDQNLRDNINYARKDIEQHVNDEKVHVTETEKATWNAKESVQGAQSKVNKVLNSLELHTNNSNMHITKAEKESFKDKYTKAETRNLVKHTLTGLSFLPSVNTYSDISIKYPNPKFNSVIEVRNQGNKAFVYNGEQWIEFNLLFTPEVTEETNGLMSNTEKIKLDTIEENANYYIHPDDIDTRHVSDAEKDYWNNKADNSLVTIINDGLMSKADKEKLDTIEENANNYTHPEMHDPSIIAQDENNRFVSDEQIKSWDNKIEKDYVDKLSSDTLSNAKSFVNTKVASIFNSAEDQLEILRSLAFELKNDTTVKKFFDLYNLCTKNEEFQEHALNDKIHMNRTDASLLQNVKSLLENGIIPNWEEIPGRPTKLPALGGNADTVENCTVNDIINKTIEWFDTTIFESDSKEISENEIDLIANRFGSIVLFKSGTYSVKKELVFNISNKIFRGINNLTKLEGASIKIIGNNNIIEDICLDNGKDHIVSTPAITIVGDNNIIRNTHITNYTDGINIEGSNNTITDNNILNIKKEAIRIDSNINSNYGNIVKNNRIAKSNIGIVLSSSNNILSRNHITKNNILGCSIGIILSNSINDSTKTILNIISENIVMRANGKTSDYLPTHKTIVSEFSSKNIINSNITLGKEIIAPYDILSNNIS